MTTLILSIALILSTPFGGNNNPREEASKTENNSLTAQSGQTSSGIKVSMEGKIDHNTYTEGQRASVTFSRFPKSVEEFKEVREKLGVEPHGAIALQIMAYEMYRRNPEMGMECIRLNNTLSNSGKNSSAIRQLSHLFHGDNPPRPYQMAAYLKGATHENGYNPTEPYTVEVMVDKGRRYGYSNDYQTTVLYLYVLTKGKSTPDVLYVLKTKKPDETSERGKYFIISNSPGLYSRVREISFDATFNGLK
ncbi:MAG: hypothetical protein Q3998_05240 [Porphyromonas sp.]|nr:hypothetical protein [Porphyromonas sp.]